MTRPPIVVLHPAIRECDNARRALEAAGYIVIVAESKLVTVYSDEAVVRAISGGVKDAQDEGRLVYGTLEGAAVLASPESKP